MSRLKERQKAKLVLACAPLEDQLADAKASHAEEHTDETRAAKREASATVHETRAWLRAKDQLDKLPGLISGLEQQLKQARLARDEKAAERVAGLERKLAAATARLARIRAQFGPLVQAMNELAGGGS